MKILIFDYYKKTKVIFRHCNIKNKLPALVFFICLSTILEIFGIGMLIPITSLFVDEESSFSQKIIYSYFKNNEKDKVLQILLIVYLTIFIIKTILVTYIEYYKSKFIHHVYRNVISTFYNEYLNTSITYFFKKNTSYIISMMSLKVGNYSGTMIAFSSLISELILSMFLGILLFILTPSSAFIIVLILVTIVFLYNRVLKNLLNRLGSKRDFHEGYWMKHLSETLNFLKEINIFDAKKYFKEISDLNLNKFIDAKFKINFFSSTGRIFFETITILFLIVFLIISSTKSESFIAIIPLMAAYVAAAIKFLPSLNRISNGLQYITYNYATTESIIKELDSITTSNQKNINELSLEKSLSFDHSIELSNIDFSYGDEKKVLNNLNIKINKGESVAIIGESGLGKSTLVEIMCSFLTPQNGEILIDGKNLKEFTVQWKKLIGYVPQQTFIINDTIRKNIGLCDISNNNINEKKIINCLKLVGLSKYLDTQQGGLDTILLEGGKSLSGGQKQRISIARNLYKGAKIIFFDEPTSALDEKSENDLLKELELIKKDTTLIIVTHKKKVADFCDKIIDLNKINARI